VTAVRPGQSVNGEHVHLHCHAATVVGCGPDNTCAPSHNETGDERYDLQAMSCPARAADSAERSAMSRYGPRVTAWGRLAFRQHRMPAGQAE
jgi:hypothetical protein